MKIKHLCLGLGMIGLVLWGGLSWVQAESDDDLLVLPGDRETPKPRKRAKAKVRLKKDTSLPPIYGPAKEWQSFRSTARITCSVREGNNLWAGTQGGGLIRWDLRNGSYRFYVPRLKRADARNVLALAAAPNGDLWIGTRYGLGWLRRGRTRWKFFRKKHGLPDNAIQALAWIRGSLWVGTRRGVARRRRGRWRRWTTRNGLPAGDIRAIGHDSRGRVWFSPNIATPFYRKGNRFIKVRKFPFVGSACIVSDRKGGVWFCSEQGAVHYKGGTIQTYTVDHGLAGLAVQSIYVDVSGGVWLGTKSKGISYFKKGRWYTMNRANGLPGLNIKAILGASGGELVAATFLSGISRYREGHWQRMPVGIVGNRIQVIAYAPDGAVWVGTRSGVSRYFQGYWFNLTPILPHPDVRAVTFDPMGRVWIGTYGGGIVRYDGKKWKTYDVMDGLASNKIVGAAITPDGLWFAHEYKGITLYNGKAWKVFRERNTSGVLSSTFPVSRIVVDHKFRLWIASKGGGLVVRSLGGGWKKVGELRTGTKRGIVYDVAGDTKGRVWIATKAGLYRYQAGRLKRFTRKDGLPSNKILSVSTEGSKVWVGTPRGVACLDGLAWRRFTRDAGLASNVIATIGITPWGVKWFGSAYDGLTIYRGE